MPGFHHPVAGAFGGDGEAVKLAGQTDREIANIDHLLHFAETFGRDLARFQRDEPTEICLEGAQFFAQKADQFATARSRHVAPNLEGGIGLVDHGCDTLDRNGLEACDLFTRYRAERRHIAAGIKIAGDAHSVEQGRGFLFHVKLRGRIHVKLSFLAQRGGKAVFDTALSTPVAVLSPNLSFCETGPPSKPAKHHSILSRNHIWP
ncbi:hypothetical protein D3C87_1387710 [compost metagenome]